MELSVRAILEYPVSYVNQLELYIGIKEKIVHHYGSLLERNC